MTRIAAALLLLACEGAPDGDAGRGAEDAGRDGGRTSDAGRVDGDAGGGTEDAGRDGGLTSDAGPRDPGTLIDDFYITYYWVVSETEYSGADDTALRDPDCEVIANVPEGFADDVCVEGTGRLTDGAVINYASNCACGHPCSSGPTVCFELLDATVFPWGAGSRDNALVPLRSWAVDNDVIEFGTVLYAPRWDGVAIPRVGELGGFVHDGCFRADDVGNGIEDRHFDFYAGNTPMWEALEELFPSIESRFDVYEGAPHCAYLATP